MLMTSASWPAAHNTYSLGIVFTYNGQAVEHVDNFKYLASHIWQHFPSHCSSKSQGSPNLGCGTTAALSAAMWQHEYLMLSLLQSILVPALHYGCKLWGMHTPTGEAKAARADLQSMYDRFLSCICMAKRGPRAKLLALSPLQVFWWQQALQFWNTIAASPFDSVFHTILLDNIHNAFHVGHGATNCSSSIATCLQAVGHSMRMPSDSGVIPIMEVDAIIEALCKHLQGIRTASHALHCPRAAPSAGIVSCTYHHWFRPVGQHRR